jgi:hypothetical protein
MKLFLSLIFFGFVHLSAHAAPKFECKVETNWGQVNTDSELEYRSVEAIALIADNNETDTYHLKVNLLNEYRELKPGQTSEVGKRILAELNADWPWKDRIIAQGLHCLFDGLLVYCNMDFPPNEELLKNMLLMEFSTKMINEKTIDFAKAREGKKEIRDTTKLLLEPHSYVGVLNPVGGRFLQSGFPLDKCKVN